MTGRVIGQRGTVSQLAHLLTLMHKSQVCHVDRLRLINAAIGLEYCWPLSWWAWSGVCSTQADKLKLCHAASREV